MKKKSIISKEQLAVKSRLLLLLHLSGVAESLQLTIYDILNQG